jgi:hypothetical protein
MLISKQGHKKRAQGAQRRSTHVATSRRQVSQRKKVIFVSYRFADEEYASGLIDLLQQSGFQVVCGIDSVDSISRTILQRIKDCDYFVCVMTRNQLKTDGTFTTSPWLLEEKGAALALGKPLVLLVEEGVTDVGGLQGDWQRIHFTAKSFLKGALQAVRQLKALIKNIPPPRISPTAAHNPM